MWFWYSLLALIAATTVWLAAVALLRRMPFYLVGTMAFTNLCGMVLFLAGLVQWVLDPLGAIGEYGDGGDMTMVAPLMNVGGLLLAGAWVPALGGQPWRSQQVTRGGE